MKVTANTQPDGVISMYPHCICKQIGVGVRKGFTEIQVIQVLLKIVTDSKIEGFLMSHLGDRASTELFQELMSAKQNDQEFPHQFLYCMIAHKQKNHLSAEAS